MRRPSPRRLGGFLAVAALIVGVVVVGLVAAARQPPAQVALKSRPEDPRARGHGPRLRQRVDVARYAGRPLIINMWASWCTGCIAEASDITRFAKDHPDVAFVGIDVTDSEGGARAFVDRYHWTHPSIFDAQGALGARLGLRGLPTTVFVRADGTVAGEALGPVTYQQLVDTASALES